MCEHAYKQKLNRTFQCYHNISTGLCKLMDQYGDYNGACCTALT